MTRLRLLARAEGKSSPAHWIASQPLEEKQKFLKSLTDRQCTELETYWPFWARDKQLEPPGDWRIWAIITGRGWGKNRTGLQWVHKVAKENPGSHGFLAARTTADARETILHHPRSGLVVTQDPENPVEMLEYRRLVKWRNGSFAHMYSSEEPDSGRGPEHDWGYADEIATWTKVKDQLGNTLWDNLQFGLRATKMRPRMVAATTPRPVPIIKQLMRDETGRVHITTGSLMENKENLAPSFVEYIEHRYGGTRIGRQEIGGELLDDLDGACVTMSMIDASRMDFLPDQQYVEAGIAVDPATTSGEESNETGIVSGLVGEDGRLYVVADDSGRHSPMEWARYALKSRDLWQADRIIAERNQGGEMVRANIQSIDPNANVELVSATQGKHIRFAPVGSLFEQGKVSMVGTFPQLEDQLCAFTLRGYEGGDSPDRADAFIWLATKMMLDEPYKPVDLW